MIFSKIGQNPILHNPLKILCYAGLFIGLFLRILNLGNVPTSAFDETRYIEAARVLSGIETFKGHDDWQNLSPEIAKSPDPNFFHPPLGKLIIGISIQLLGDTPQGWRAPSLIFGLISVILFYLLSMKIFSNEEHSLFATAIFALDFQTILHSRTAMLDTFVAFAFLAAFYGYILVKENKNVSGLLIIGVSIFFGASVKHVAFLIMPSLLFLEIFYSGLKADKTKIQLIATFSALCSLYLFWSLFYKDHSFSEWIKLQVDANRSLMSYFKPHRYGSHPSQWLFNGKPIWYFFEIHNDKTQGLLCWGTPITWWLLFPAIMQTYLKIRTSNVSQNIRSVLIYFIAYMLAMFYILRNREGFLYYMLPMIPFMYLLIAQTSIDWDKGKSRVSSSILLLSIFLAIWFSPVLAGFPVDRHWIDSIIAFAGN